MKLQPLITLWLLVPVAIAGSAALGWYIYSLRKSSREVLFPWIRRAALFVLLVLMALGISLPGGTSSPGVANLDVLIAVDTTASMGTEDYAGATLRMEGVKKDLAALGEKLKGAHFTIVTFDSRANVILPSTADNATFAAAVSTLSLEIYGTSRGSAIDKPVEISLQQLKRSKVAHPDRSRLFFYMGDGEQTSDAEVGSFKSLAPYIDGGAALGYGTTAGAKIQRYTGLQRSGAPQYINTIDPATKALVPAISKLDETAMKKIAKELDIVYRNRNVGSPVDELYQASEAKLHVDKSKKVTHYQNIYWLFAIPIGALIFWEWKQVLLLTIELRKHQRSQNA